LNTLQTQWTCKTPRDERHAYKSSNLGAAEEEKFLLPPGQDTQCMNFFFLEWHDRVYFENGSSIKLSKSLSSGQIAFVAAICHGLNNFLNKI
jgi:hypothetical protein